MLRKEARSLAFGSRRRRQLEYEEEYKMTRVGPPRKALEGLPSERDLIQLLRMLTMRESGDL